MADIDTANPVIMGIDSITATENFIVGNLSGQTVGHAAVAFNNPVLPIHLTFSPG